MFSFRRTDVPRTRTAHSNPVYYEDGRSSQDFHSPSHAYLVTHTSPATTPEHGRSFFNPPSHFHTSQTEEFYVVSGLARFFLDNETHMRGKGEVVQVPTGAFHSYENASETGEDLVVSLRLNEQTWVTEERFFRNFFGYLDDVRKAGQQPSIFQIFRFLHSINAPLAVPVLGAKSHWVSRQVSWFILFVAGVVVGKWLLGYQDTYPEYYAGDEDKNK